MLSANTRIFPVAMALISAFSTSAMARESNASAELAAVYAAACDDTDAICVTKREATSFFAEQESVQAATHSTPMTAVPSSVSWLHRRQLTNDVAEYSVTVWIGPQPEDQIGLHRVVREIAPYVPRKTSKSVMLVHGDVWDFQGAFLANGDAPANASIAVYLAQQNIDVWGIDLGWTMVPSETTNLGFMENWGFAHDMRDIGIALGIARTTRTLTGHGHSKMHLLGWSRGAQLGYGYLDGESQMPPGLRHVAGFIPVDIYLKTNVAELRQNACSRLAVANVQMQNGVYANDIGKTAAFAGIQALAAPMEMTPIPDFQPLTNAGVANFLGAATYMIVTPPFVPFYHFAAGAWDDSGLVTDLVLTDSRRFYDFMAKAHPYQPWRELADAEIAVCNDPTIADVPFDDHLSSITNPILYVGAGGGFGADGNYTTTLLGSNDVTTHVVQLVPSEYRLLDVGHGDIFQGTNAQSMFWSTIKDWIHAH